MSCKTVICCVLELAILSQLVLIPPPASAAVSPERVALREGSPSQDTITIPERVLGTGRVRDVAFSPDGKKALLASAGGFAILADLRSGTIETYYLGHAGAVTSAAFSPDGDEVVTAGSDKTAILWNRATAEQIRTFQGHTRRITSVAFSPDGQRILTGSDDDTARLWDATTGEEICVFSGHESEVTDVVFSPDGSSVLTGSEDDTARLWDSSTGEPIRTFSGHTSDVSSVAFSPDGTTLLTGSHDLSAKVWDAATGEEIQAFTFSDIVRSVAFAPDGSAVLIGDGVMDARLFDLTSGEEIRTFQHHPSHWTYCFDVAFSPDGTQILTGEGDYGSAKVWDVESGAELVTFSGHLWDVESVAFSGDGTQVLTSGDFMGTAKLWDATTGQKLRTFAQPAWSVSAAALSPDGTLVVVGTNGHHVKLRDAATGEEIRAFPGHSGAITSLAFSPDGTLIASGSRDDTVKIWEVATGREVATLSGHSGDVTSVAFSPDGTQVLTGSHDDTAKLWDAATGNEVRTFANGYGGVLSVAFSPDGTRVVTGAFWDTATLWDASTADELRTFSGHGDYVSSVAFSPDGTKVLTGSGDETARLWEASTGEEVRAFAGHTGRVSSVAFSPDGTTVLSGSSDRTARLWPSGLDPVPPRRPEALTIGESTEDTVLRFAFEDYALDATQGQHMLVEVTPLEGADGLWVYGRRSQLPTLAEYDVRARRPTPDGPYQLLIPSTQRGTYYLSVFGQDVSRTGGGYRVEARVVDHYLSDLSPRSAGNAGRVTLQLSGLGFVEGMTVELAAPGLPTITPKELTLVSATSMWARFDLSDAATGTYDVVASWPEKGVLQLSGAFTVSQGSGPRLQARLVAPDVVRAGREYSLRLEYANEGDAALPAPLFLVSGSGETQLRLSSEEPWTTQALQVLGISFDPPAGELQPGTSYQIPILFQTEESGEVAFELERMGGGDAAIDWDAVETDVRPDSVDADLWDVTWNRSPSRYSSVSMPTLARSAAIASAISFGLG